MRGSSKIDVDDEPVVEEGAVGHVEAEHVAHGAVGAVAADDVAGTDGRCLARPPQPQAAVPVRLDVDAFAMHGDSGAVVFDGGHLDTPADLDPGELSDACEQQRLQLGLGEHG